MGIYRTHKPFATSLPLNPSWTVGDMTDVTVSDDHVFIDTSAAAAAAAAVDAGHFGQCVTLDTRRMSSRPGHGRPVSQVDSSACWLASCVASNSVHRDTGRLAVQLGGTAVADLLALFVARRSSDASSAERRTVKIRSHRHARQNTRESLCELSYSQSPVLSGFLSCSVFSATDETTSKF